MEKRMVKAVSGFLAGMLCVSVFSMSAFAEGEESFDERDTGSGYAVAEIRDSAVKDGQVVIPDEIDGIPVTQLGAKDKTSTFLGQRGVTRLGIGKNVRDATTTAFYGADDLREIEISQENKGTLAFDSETGVLRATAGGNERKSYRVPDGTGLFKQVFGMEYGEISCDAQVMEHGDAALNAVSCVLYETLDGVSPDEICGMGYGIFTKEKVEEYLSCLREAAEHYPRYNVTPEFSVNGGILSFHRAGNGYESEAFTVDTVDGTGAEDSSRGYTLSITTPGMTVKATGQKSFQTGTQVVLVSETAPTEISVSYQEPSLKFYRRTSSGVQDVLCSAMKESHKTPAAAILVNDLAIFKEDITTGKELPGAELTLSKDGRVIEKWISGDTPHIITGLSDGDYVLTEVTAPKGYEIAESIGFEVVNGEVAGGPVVMKDKAKTATPSDAVPATPSDAAPATPSDAAPSKPESPKKPDRPTAEEKPSKPENPSGGNGQSSASRNGGGHRRITGNSTSGPGVAKPEAVNREVPKPVEPFPAKASESEKTYVLPKTGDRSAAPAIALVSFLLLIGAVTAWEEYY